VVLFLAKICVAVLLTEGKLVNVSVVALVANNVVSPLIVVIPFNTLSVSKTVMGEQPRMLEVCMPVQADITPLKKTSPSL
jgi:hypothetical protein